MKVSLIIPFKNEEVYAKVTMERAFQYLTEKEVDFELIVVDDSTDNTWDIIQHLSKDHQNIIAVKGEEGTTGYGSALRKGFRLATGDVIIPFNGDLCDNIEDVSKFVALIEAGYDMVFGSRYMQQSTVIGAPAFKGILSRIGNVFLQFLYQSECNDLTNSFKAYRKSVLETLVLTSDGYSIVIETALKGISHNFRYTTIPITWTGRTHGLSKMSVLKVIPYYISMALKIRFGQQDKI